MTFDLDESIGLILDKLEELGLDSNTYIIYSSDNGSVPIITPKKHYKQSYNHPLQRGKWDAKEGGIRVPFIVMGPGIDWRANEQVTLPLDISHDIYGNELDYGFEAEHSDSRLYCQGFVSLNPFPDEFFRLR